MATESQARLVRDKYQGDLAKKGAHSISVEPLPGTKDFAVVAWTNRKLPKLPKQLSFSDQDGTISVPLVVRSSKPFALE